MTLQLFHSDFLIYEENLIFFFISAHCSVMGGKFGYYSPSFHPLPFFIPSSPFLYLFPLPLLSFPFLPFPSRSLSVHRLYTHMSFVCKIFRPSSSPPNVHPPPPPNVHPPPLHCKDKIPKFRKKYSQKRNIRDSVPISTFMCL
jgi:hypothetical protein